MINIKEIKILFTYEKTAVMKVLITCISESWGGMEMYSLQSAKFLLNEGHDVELLCYPGSKLHIESHSSGVKVHLSKFRNYFSPIQIFKTAIFLKKNNFDLIHVQASKELWLMVPALQLAFLKTPMILTKHCGSYIKKKDLFHRWLYGRIELALAVSSVIKKNLVDTTPLPEERIELLHNAVDMKIYDCRRYDRRKIRREFTIADNEILIGMNARITPGKGYEEFLHAAKELTKKYDHLKFLAIGEASRGENDYAAKIFSLSKELELEGKFIFAGYRNDVPEVLAALDIFVFPSHAEAFGLALIEAMSSGLPSVCSNSDGVMDIAVEGITSYLFEPQNKTEFLNKLIKLIEEPETRIKFGIAARERVEECFDTRLFVCGLIAIYEKVLNSRSNRVAVALHHPAHHLK